MNNVDIERRLGIIDSGLQKLVKYGIPITNNVKAMLYTIGMVESDFQNRHQIVYEKKIVNGTETTVQKKGPARGLWQFEETKGVFFVLNNANKRNVAREIGNEYLATGFNDNDAWNELEKNDDLAVVFARILLTKCSINLPEPNLLFEEIMWGMYLCVWGPKARGEDKRTKWGNNWKEICIYFNN